MSWSLDTTVIAAINWGLPTSPRLVPTEGYNFYGKVAGTAHTLHGLDGGVIMSFANLMALNDWGGSQLIAQPNVIKEGITGWFFEKSSNSTTCYIRFKDANGVPVYSIQLDWAPSISYIDLARIGEDPISIVPEYGDMQAVHLILGASSTDPNQPMGFLWGCDYTSFTAQQGEWRAWPAYVNNCGVANLNQSSIMDYIDSLFEGDYHGNDGLISPTGGAGGGGGSFYRPTYGIQIPSLPTISACDTGMMSIYSVSTAQLQALGAYMWDQSFYNSLVKLFQSPLDNIITLQSVPLPSGAFKGVASNIIIGNVDTGIASNFRLTTSFYEIDCGVINVTEFYKNFADYTGFLDLHCVLPYIGVVRISPDDCMGGKIKVVYHVDVFSGSCVAFIQCFTNGVWTVLSEHAGNIIAQFPVTGTNFASVYVGAINSLTATVSGNVVGAFNQASNIKPSYGRSGGVTSVAGLMGVQKPYLIFSTPKYITASNFGDVKGYTSNLTVNIGSQSGYLQATADNSELSGISNATADELEMIRTMLSDGIYV